MRNNQNIKMRILLSVTVSVCWLFSESRGTIYREDVQRNLTYDDADYGQQQEGDVCGPCYNPSNNNDCGKCVLGLECVKNKDPFRNAMQSNVNCAKE